MSNIIETGASGPYHAASASVAGEEPREVWLCRCGMSQSKPFCDGSHRAAGFTDAAVYTAGKIEEVSYAALSIDPRPNGPLLASGGVEVCDASGAVIFRGERCALCRCGGSATKPFCDGSHRALGFAG